MKALELRLLGYLANGEWRLQLPKGIGPKTVDRCIERALVKTRRVPIAYKGDIETFCMPLRITKTGRIVYLIERNRITGRVGRELIAHRLRQLRKLIGVGAVRSLQMGKSVLKQWRRTTPHNWWIENRKQETLWHSEDRKHPDTVMFDAIEHSEHRIFTGSFLTGADEGKPEQTTYRLKRAYC